MLDTLIRNIFVKDRKLEEHFSRQAQAAEAEIAAMQARQRKATRKAFSPLDPDIERRYQKHLAENRDPVLAEMRTVRDMQELSLARAFSILDFE